MKSQAEKMSFEQIFYLFDLLLKARYQTKNIEVESLPLEIAALDFINHFSQKENKQENSLKDKEMTENTNFSGRGKNKERNNKTKVKKPKQNKKFPTIDNFDKKWEEVVNEIKKFNHSISVFLSKSEAKLNNNEIEIYVPYRLYFNTLNSSNIRRHLNRVIHKIFHYPFDFTLYLGEKKE